MKKLIGIFAFLSILILTLPLISNVIYLEKSNSEILYNSNKKSVIDDNLLQKLLGFDKDKKIGAFTDKTQIEKSLNKISP